MLLAVAVFLCLLGQSRVSKPAGSGVCSRLFSLSGHRGGDCVVTEPGLTQSCLGMELGLAQRLLSVDACECQVVFITLRVTAFLKLAKHAKTLDCF